MTLLVLMQSMLPLHERGREFDPSGSLYPVTVHYRGSRLRGLLDQKVAAEDVRSMWPWSRTIHHPAGLRAF